MPRYIEAEKLEKEGWSASRIYPQDAKTMVYETKKMTDFPTADVVEVVRCKDCVHHKNAPKTTDVWCDRLDGLLPQDWFCADGEKGEKK